MMPGPIKSSLPVQLGSGPGQLESAHPRLEGVTAVVLAGGRGARLAPLTDNLPKPLVPVAGRPFLYWVTSWLIRQGVPQIVYTAGHLGDQIETWVAGLRLAEHARAVCRRERSPLGTGGAVLACLDVCQNLVLIVNGDTLLLAELSPIISRFRADRLDGLIVAVPVADASRFGTLERDDDGLLRTLREKQPGAGLISGGVYLFPRAILERYLPIRPLSMEVDVVPGLLRGGARIGVAPADAPFLDIGVPEALALADEFVAMHRAGIVSSQT